MLPTPDIALPPVVIPKQRTAISGAPMPGTIPIRDARTMPPDGIPLEYPAIEDLPEFAGRFEPAMLAPSCRSFNGSLCDWQGQRIMAYRSEDFRGMNRIFVARLNSEFGVTENVLVDLPPFKGQHWEDPHIAVVGGKLHLMANSVRFGVPNVCQQRLFVLGSDLQPEKEIGPLPYGSNTSPGGVEKNWLPFQLPDGKLGIIYSQRPRVVIEIETSRGHSTPGLVGWRHGARLNGRTPPLRVSEDFYLEFFGGWVKHSWRNGRYFVGAHIFEAKAPFALIAATEKPLCWGTEASPTLFSPRPGNNHPCAILPAGVVLDGNELTVSAGINDSYIVLLRYRLSELISSMTAVNKEGGFEA